MSFKNSFLKKSFLPVTLLSVGVFASACGSHGKGANSDASATEAHGQSPASSLSTAKIGSFNMMRLGNGDTKDYDRLAEVVMKGDFQIFAGVEVMNPDGAEEVRSHLASHTGKDWQVLLSKTANGESSYKEYLAYFYRADIVTPELPDDSFCNSTDGAEVTDQGACFAKDRHTGGEAQFDRDPFVAHVKIGDAHFSFAAVHLFYGGTDSASTERRIGELKAFRKVLNKIKESTPNSDVIGLGDFNLALPTFEFDNAVDADPVLSAESSNAKMPDEFFTALPKITGLIDGPTTIGFSSYDHILVFDDNQHKPIDGTGKIISDFNLQSSTQRAKYKTEVSDHYPVGVDFGLLGN